MSKKELKTNAMRILDRAGIPYTYQTYECGEFTDGVHVADQLGLPHERVYKTLVTVGRTGAHYVFVIPIAEEIDFKKAAKAVGEKSVSMIPVAEINRVTGYIRGGCSPIGMKKQYPTVIDETCQLFDTIIFSGGRIGTQVEMNPEELKALIGASFADITAG